MLFYYFGAILLPVCMWYLPTRLIQKYNIAKFITENSEKTAWMSLSGKQKSLFIIVVTSIFLFMELFWRMLFEFLIAYMQIRDALLQSSI